MTAVDSPTAARQDGQSNAIYQRRRRERTVICRIVQHHLESWFARRREADPDGEFIPSYVERNLQNNFNCGILAHEEQSVWFFGVSANRYKRWHSISTDGV